MSTVLKAPFNLATEIVPNDTPYEVKYILPDSQSIANPSGFSRPEMRRKQIISVCKEKLKMKLFE